MIHRSEHCIPASHPALPGHFPGNPVIPGVVLLDEVISAIGHCLPDTPVVGFQSVKFLNPVGPDTRFSVALERLDAGRIRFSSHHGQTLLNAGIVLVDASRADP